ncbi:unnamed protein product [Mytilus edulis]|uniref:ZMYM2-like/QRICH1 C-terminal domain-containing protein n=1 Tax=Mytilus edulis TaxID=6550 RepID=A0A8S3VHI0_MYTED|nr:unnamed protein product [Mytilus edulis]
MATEADDERFMTVTNDDTSNFIEEMKNDNTKRKTKSDIKLLTEWLKENNELRAIEDISVPELNQYLARFYLSVRSRKNEEYEPDSLKSIQSSINRHLMEKSGINILKDKEFHHSREVLSAKRKHLKSQGLGNKKMKADPFSSSEIDMLFEQNLLGTGNPEALLNTIWLNNTLHFGMRGRKEHTDMLFGDIKMMTTASGEQYLEYNERLTKTRTGHSDSRAFAPKMFATPAIGKNTLGDLAKKMSMKGGLTGRKVNHSVRKTTVSSLLHSNVEATTVMQLTGHKNVAFVNEYSSASLQQQQTMSNILSDIGSGSRGLIPQEPTPNTSFEAKSADFPEDDIFDSVELNEVCKTIENFESVEKNVKINSGKCSTFSILPQASIGNVTINIYNSEK